MTISSTTRKAGPTAGNSVTTAFPFAFKVFAETDITVVLNVIATGVQTVLTYNVDYTVALNADQNANPGGTVTYTGGGTPLPATKTLTINSAVPQLQSTHLVNGGAYLASNIEDALDRETILAQQNSLAAAYAFRAPAVDSAAPADLPAAAQRANRYFAFDASGAPIVAAGTASVPVSAAMAPVVQAATTDAGLGLLGFSVFFRTLIGAATKAALTALFTPLTTKGDLWSFGAADARLAVPADSKVLYGDSSQASGWNSILLALHGNCQLTKSGANLLLSPFNGNTLIVNSLLCTVPDAGVTLAPPAVASTTYYIYAVATNGVITSLENSATAPAVQAGTGIKIKNGDATRTLVGMARTTAGNAWADTSAQRFVRSWFNDYGFGQSARFSVDRSTSSATFIEVNSEIRCEFLLWSGETYVASVNGSGNDTTSANRGPSTSVGFDSTTANEPVECYSPNATAGLYTPVALSYPKTALAEGYHYVTLLGRIIAGGTVSNYLGVSGTIGAVCLTGYVSARR